MRRLPVTALLIALVANLTVERSPVRYVVAHTTADVNLFVDPTGSDSSSCTSPGLGACATPQGAINKIPKYLRHRATITAAAGNYPSFNVSGFVTDTGHQQASAGILLDGTMV